jgi:hypothetical protein
MGWVLQAAALAEKQGLAGQLQQARDALEALRGELLAAQGDRAGGKQEELPAWLVQSRSR